MAGQMASRLFHEAFEVELLERAEENPNVNAWSAAGRGKTKKNPAGEDGTWWRAHGPPMVQNWIDWRHRSGWQIWTTPEGQPGIELPIDLADGASGINVKMFIDRVFILPSKALAIVDLKTGARTPESDLQLAIYRYGIFKQFGVDIRLGAYWMARQGECSDVFDLARFDPRLIELWLQRFKVAIEHDIFIPHPTFRCRACSLRDYCAAYGGSQSNNDPDTQLVTGESA